MKIAWAVMTFTTINEYENARRLVGSIVTSNYISQAMVTFGYLKETNPSLPYLVLIIGERSTIESDLPKGPRWMFWDELIEESARYQLAKEYLPFELACVLRGHFHRYLASQPEIEKWALIDTDIGVLASLDPLFDALDRGPIALTLHSTKPIQSDRIVPQESNLLELGLYNGGVVAMRHSEEALHISQWLCERLELYGRCHRSRHWQGLESQSFEYVDQIWLNLIPVYHPNTVIIRDEVFNLGHWNLYQGELSIQGGRALFDGKPVVMIHFSGLPKDRLDFVAAHDSIYREKPCQAWAELASEYLRRSNLSKAEHFPFPYCYIDIQPNSERGRPHQLPTAVASSIHTVGSKRNKIKRAISRLRSPRQLYGGFRYIGWRLSAGFASLINRDRLPSLVDRLIDRDFSDNGFTGLRACIGNYQTYLVRYHILQAVISAMPSFSGRLLDVGAGSSPYEELIMASGKVSEYIKLDFANSDYHQGHELDLTWDGKTIPLDAQSIDTVFMTEVLEHVHRPGDLLREVRRVLKPGGVLFLTVPFIWPMHELPYDYHRFTPVALKAYLEEADFNVLNIQILGGWDHSLAQLLGLWLTNRSMGARKRKLAKLLAWPLYSFLLRRGKGEFTAIRNHQMHIGLACVAIASE
jgi:SAM-dependent methyltransferase